MSGRPWLARAAAACQKRRMKIPILMIGQWLLDENATVVRSKREGERIYPASAEVAEKLALEGGVPEAWSRFDELYYALESVNLGQFVVGKRLKFEAKPGAWVEGPSPGAMSPLIGSLVILAEIEADQLHLPPVA